MQIIQWHNQTEPQESTLRQQMLQGGLSPYTWSNGPGDEYAVHSHSYQKVLYCVRGSIRFILPDEHDEQGNIREIELTPGDCMILPAHIRHGAAVGPRGVTCLEAAQH